MLVKYFSVIRNYVLSVSSQSKYNFYHQNTLLDAFRTNSRNIIGRNPSMVIPLLANQDLTSMLIRGILSSKSSEKSRAFGHPPLDNTQQCSTFVEQCIVKSRERFAEVLVSSFIACCCSEIVEQSVLCSRMGVATE